MLVEVLVEDPRWQGAGLEALVATACRAVLVHMGLQPDNFEISLLGCDDAQIVELNTRFRGKAQPTNVLAWPSEARSTAPGQHPVAPMDCELGNVAIAFDTCAREAGEQGKDFTAHVSHLLVHACLHLLGYDHINARDAALMEALEVEILGKLGISDPYEGTGR